MLEISINVSPALKYTEQFNKKNKFFYLIQVWALICLFTSMKRFCSVQIFPRWNSWQFSWKAVLRDLLYIPHTSHPHSLAHKVCVWLQEPLLLSLHGNPCTWWRTTMRCETFAGFHGRFLWRHQPSAPVWLPQGWVFMYLVLLHKSVRSVCSLKILCAVSVNCLPWMPFSRSGHIGGRR